MSEIAPLIILVLLILFLPPVVLYLNGNKLREQGNDAAKIFFKLTGLWFVFIGVIFLVGLGVCGTL